MRKTALLILTLLVALSLLLSACGGKGNTITGTAVADVNIEEDDHDEGEEVAENHDEEEESVLGDVDAPDYSEHKGTCTEDSGGTVRVFDDAGKKTVYRNTCFGDKLIDYGCDENGQLESDNVKCPNTCDLVRYVGKCV